MELPIPNSGVFCYTTFSLLRPVDLRFLILIYKSPWDSNFQNAVCCLHNRIPVCKMLCALMLRLGGEGDRSYTCLWHVVCRCCLFKCSIPGRSANQYKTTQIDKSWKTKFRHIKKDARMKEIKTHTKKQTSYIKTIKNRRPKEYNLIKAVPPPPPQAEARLHNAFFKMALPENMKTVWIPKPIQNCNQNRTITTLQKARWKMLVGRAQMSCFFANRIRLQNGNANVHLHNAH